MNKNIFKYMILLILIVTGCSKKVEETEIVSAKKISVEKISKKEIMDIYEGDSVAVPKEKVNYMTESSGTVIAVNKKNGDTVKKGEVIIELYDATVEAEYIAAKASYQAAKAALGTAETNNAKYKKLYDKGSASEKEYSDINNKYTDALGTYLSKKAKLEEEADKFNKLKRMAQNNGIIGNLDAKIGNKIEKGNLLFTIIDESEMEASVDFPGKWFTKIKVGGPVTLSVPEIGINEFTGYIKEINPIADPETKKYKVKLGIPNFSGPDQMIKDGMYLKSKVPAGKRSVLVVPQKSVQIRGLSSYVYVEKDGIAKRLEVTTGTVNTPYVEISSNEVAEGDLVIVEGIFGLNDGDKVEISNQ